MNTVAHKRSMKTLLIAGVAIAAVDVYKRQAADG